MFEKYSKRRLIGSSITTIISLSLVLFMLGFLALIILNAHKLADNVKENIGIQVVLNDDAKEVNVKRLSKTLDARRYVKSTKFTTKEEAAIDLQDELGEEFLEFLEFNPLLGSIMVHLDASYANTDSLYWIERELLADKSVKEVLYQKSLVDMINQNLKQIGLVLLVLSGLFSVIALALINNTIRLTIYSKRFNIRTMQLVGATQGFIRRPFVWKGIGNGVLAAFLAIGMLIGVLYLLEEQLPELKDLQDERMLIVLFVLVLVLGILIAWFSTSLAVRKYLRLKTDKLYF